MLDKANSLFGWVAIWLTLIAGVVGWMQEETPPQQFELSIQLVDSTDRTPLSGVDVRLRSNQKFSEESLTAGKLVQTEQRGIVARSDESGRVAVTISEAELKWFICTANVSGFGPVYGRWDDQDVNRTLPQSITLELDPGWTVSGQVIDDKGQPVEDAVVSPRIQYKVLNPGGRTIYSGRDVKTNAEGIWRYDCVPGDQSELKVEIQHPHHKPFRGTLTRSQYSADLDTPGEIKLERGLTITGTVTDSLGDSIAGATVRVRFMNDVRHTKTIMDGTFELGGCEPGKARVVVTAEGFAVDLQTVQIQEKTEPVDFQLEPGKTITVIVQDENGDPLPKSRIFFQRWRDQHAYFELGHVNQYADDQGVWRWIEAPADAVTVDVCRPDGMNLAGQVLVAREEPYVFNPPPQLFVSGTVVDAESGSPIEEFTVIPGLEQESGRRNFSRRQQTQGLNGEFRIRHHSQTYPAHLVKIEAPGYSPAVSRRINCDEGEAKLEFKLTPAPPITSVVQDSAGNPAQGVVLILGIAGSQISIENGRLDRSSTYNAPSTKTDAEGNFALVSQGQPYKLIALHDELGYAVVESDGKTSLPSSIKLTAWSEIGGTFKSQGELRPGTGITMSTATGHFYGSDEPNIFWHYDVTTDKHGQFRFPRVTSGKCWVSRHIMLTVDQGATEVVSSRRYLIQAESGMKHQLNVGESGRQAKGRLESPDDDTNWSFALVEVLNGSAMARPIDENRISITATVNSDGTFLIDDIPPGRYVLNVQMTQQSRNIRENFGFEILSDGDPGEPQDLGVITTR